MKQKTKYNLYFHEYLELDYGEIPYPDEGSIIIKSFNKRNDALKELEKRKEKTYCNNIHALSEGFICFSILIFIIGVFMWNNEPGFKFVWSIFSLILGYLLRKLLRSLYWIFLDLRGYKGVNGYYFIRKIKVES